MSSAILKNRVEHIKRTVTIQPQYAFFFVLFVIIYDILYLVQLQSLLFPTLFFHELFLEKINKHRRHNKVLHELL